MWCIPVFSRYDTILSEDVSVIQPQHLNFGYNKRSFSNPVEMTPMMGQNFQKSVYQCAVLLSFLCLISVFCQKNFSHSFFVDLNSLIPKKHTLVVISAFMDWPFFIWNVRLKYSPAFEPRPCKGRITKDLALKQGLFDAGLLCRAIQQDSSLRCWVYNVCVSFYCPQV